MSQSTLGSTPYRNSDLFSGYYLQERVDDLEAWDCDEEAEAVFEELRDRWEKEGELVASYNEDTLLGSWIDVVLEALGYDTIQETALPDTGGYIDRVLYDDAADRRDAMAMKQDGQLAGAFGRAAALLEAKQWDTDFSERFSEQRSYRDASHQVKYYLEHTPESLQWGILTDGKKWRLYGTKDYATETYYEVDLPEILASGDLEQFKYFYLFFRPEAFREVGGSTFLETVWSESETAAQELGEDLQDNVFTALRVLGEGFVETNDLDIDPDDEEALAELKEQSLVLLYRLMFVLYAESRHLIDPEDPEDRAEYRENFSLDEIRLDIHDRIESGETFDEAYSEYSHSIWSQLQDLFRLVDTGEDSLGVSAYNGGLFDREQHEFLAEHSVSDRYIAEVIYRLGTTETADGSFALADYADLDTRHLGTIYEGLLEHEFRIAPEEYAAVAADGGQVWKPATEVSVADAVESVEEGDLYVVNDEGERKATGAYYTPDYVVSYIVEETVDPLLDELEDDLDEQGLERGTEEYVVAFWDGVTDLRVLDPAMGSGHFLTSATEYLASAVMERVRELETATLFDEQQIRREISRECIYGVDVNGMATELAKLSMWLETLATDQPLAFLDHHLKTGNSLVGSDISEVLGTDEPNGTEQATLFDDFSRTRRQALEHVMDLVEDLLAIDNVTVEDAKEMEDLYEEIREDDLYERLFGMANVHTAERFDLDVPDGAYKQMANAIDDADDWAEVESEDWYTTAQAMAEEEQFFHWELEYPEVFFGMDGERKEGAGFDAVVGNPPWVATAGRSSISANMDRTIRSYLAEQFTSTNEQFDLYIAFYEQFLNLSRSGNTGIIVPDAILTREQNKHIRKYILDHYGLSTILDVGMVFNNVENGAAVLITGEDEGPIRCGDCKGVDDYRSVDLNLIPSSVFENEEAYRFLIYLDEKTRGILQKMGSCQKLSVHIDISRGEEIGKTAEFLEETKTDENRVIVPGSAVLKYGFDKEEIRYIPKGRINKELSNYESPKLLFRQTSDRPIGTFDDSSRISIKSVYNIHTPQMSIEETKWLLGVLNSAALRYYHNMKHAAYRSVFPQINQSTFKSLPVPELVRVSEVADLVNQQIEQREQRESLNTDLLDYLGNFEFNRPLPDFGLYQPAAEPDSILHEASGDTADHVGIRIGEVHAVREGPNSVKIEATARYRPDEDEDFVESDFKPAFRLTDLSETEAGLIEAFVPIADYVDGANFRTKATKNISLMDRLEDITLPRVDDVADGLNQYRETRERADELDEKIQRTDDLIDEIVYDLYDLTDEEIEIVEESVE